MVCTHSFVGAQLQVPFVVLWDDCRHIRMWAKDTVVQWQLQESWLLYIPVAAGFPMGTHMAAETTDGCLATEAQVHS